jgi:hypothetical protein
MKYYIPTSSLNLDNILQAESISPRSFYAQRKTGYKSIELIDEVKQFNSIVLFDYPVSFSIEDPGRYNYPLLIEIEDDSQLQDIHNVEGTNVYLCNHTISLTPQNSAFYFFADNAYELTTINTKSNKSIKYYEKYNIFRSTLQLNLNSIKIDNFTDAVAVCESHETTIDKHKGVFYTFLMGQLLSVTQELAHQQRLSQELYNILTGIISNPQMKDNFLNKLKPLLEEYKSIDFIELKNKERFENKLDAELGRFCFLKHYLIDILEKWEVWNYVVQRLSNKWECDWLPSITNLSSIQDFIDLRCKIEMHTNDAIIEHKKQQPIPSIVSVLKNEDIIQIKDMPIVNKTVDYIIKNQLTADYLTANRQNVCKKLIRDIVVEEIKNNKGIEYWDNSPEQKYFNSLYIHIGDLGKPFNLNSINNPELLAIASFLLRGHDINGLLAYLKSNEICDYRYALVLWGALCGYMEMNKEFLTEILTSENYKNVYECLFHKPMGELKLVSNKENLKKEDDKTLLIKTVGKIDNNEILSFINTLIAKCKGAAKDKHVYEEHFKKHAMSKELLQAIKEDKRLNKGKGVQKTIITWLEKEINSKSEKQKKQIDQMPTLFTEEKPLSENRLFFTIDKLSCFENANEDIVRRLKDNWDFVKKDRNNRSTQEKIRYFINLCKKEGEGRSSKPTALFGFFTDKIANACKKELENRLL